MGFSKLKLELSYRSNTNDFAKEFFNPVLTESVLYRRAAGYFASSVFLEIGDAVKNVLARGGHIRIICSPHLTLEDFAAIKAGYEKRHDTSENSAKSMDSSRNSNRSYSSNGHCNSNDHNYGYEVLLQKVNASLLQEFDGLLGGEELLEMVSDMIATGALDIKIALTKDFGLYHEKVGIFTDEEGNKISFSGSINETQAGITGNLESFEVFKSWDAGFDSERITKHEEWFDGLWNKHDPGMIVIDIPEVKTEFIKKFRNARSPQDRKHILSTEFSSKFPENNDKTKDNTNPAEESSLKPSCCGSHWFVPKDIVFRPYQLQAVDTWIAKGFRGIFEMATGSGKTLTAIWAMVRLAYEKQKYSLVAVIVCPYQHLVEQWCDDLKRFGIDPVVGYGSSQQKNWRMKLANTITSFSWNKRPARSFCFITTNDTFCSEFVQRQLMTLEKHGHNLILIDEAHNAGAPGMKRSLLNLSDIFSYRLALSATFERHHDEEGTEFLREYFGPVCLLYSLDMAIRAQMLTKYYYHPCIVTLNFDEREKYIELTEEIRHSVESDGQGGTRLTQKGKMLCLERARLVACVQGKLEMLREVIKEHDLASAQDLLVYCGVGMSDSSATYNENNENNGNSDTDIYAELSVSETRRKKPARQIDQVTRMLYGEFGMRVHSFTSEHSSLERKELIRRFEAGDLQALVAIRCLDEGVNIPSIRTAVIMASTTNPKEYIQRRGRVLRLYPGKEYATIYDFITLPYSLYETDHLTRAEKDLFTGLVRNEMIRCQEFAQLAINRSEGREIFRRMQEAYRLTERNLDEAFDEEETYGL